ALTTLTAMASAVAVPSSCSWACACEGLPLRIQNTPSATASTATPAAPTHTFPVRCFCGLIGHSCKTVRYGFRWEVGSLFDPPRSENRRVNERVELRFSHGLLLTLPASLSICG